MKPARRLGRILDELARRGLAVPPPRPAATGLGSSAAPLRFGRLPRTASLRVAGSPRPVSVGGSIPGREVAAPDGGRAWVATNRSPSPVPPPGERPEGLLFLDIETTGLSCSPLFLIGAMTFEGDDLEVRQYLARDYSEEAAAIALFASDAAGRERLVTFNGKSYDLPYIRMRAAATGTTVDLDLPHTDLLHEARRAWPGRFPDFRLQTLEARLLGHRRRDDIPGAEIPDAYHAFVRTGEAGELARIVDHNRRDLVTLAELLFRLPG